MKILLILLIVLSAGCQSTPTLVKSERMGKLDMEFAEIKNSIILDCKDGAFNIQQVAIQRDDGIPKRLALSIIFQYIKNENIHHYLDPPLTTSQVLSLIILTDMIYNKPYISSQELYDIFYEDCLAINYKEVDEMYEDFKRRIKIMNE